MTTPRWSAGLPIIREDVADIIERMGNDAERFAGRSVLITGAAGFLPSYMADVLAVLNDEALSRPCRVVLLVRRPIESDSRLGHLLGRPDVEFVVQDVSVPAELAGCMDFIVHAASAASPQWYRTDPVGTIAANVLGLRWLMEHARERGSESVLYFSSSEVYGLPDASNIPTAETYAGNVDFTSSRACYSEAKRLGESLCVAYHQQYGVPVKSVRPFHIHGPGLRLDDGRIVAEMMARGLRGEPFQLLSDGKASRTYGYVSDAADGFFRALLSSADGEAFNVGADAPETSILELTGIIASLFGGGPVTVNQDPLPEHLSSAPSRVCPDLTKIRSRLGYSPHVPLEAGLARTADWFRNVYGQGVSRG